MPSSAGFRQLLVGAVALTACAGQRTAPVRAPTGPALAGKVPSTLELSAPNGDWIVYCRAAGDSAPLRFDDHGGFLGEGFGQPGQTEAFAETLRRVLDAHERADQG